MSLQAWVIGVLLVLMIGASQAEERAVATSLNEVTASELEGLLDRSNHVLVVFTYARDRACVECRAMEHEVELLADDVADLEIVFLDCPKRRTEQVCKPYVESGKYPALRLFSEGLAVYDYPARRVHYEALRDWAAKMTSPKYATVSSATELEASLEGAKRDVVVGFFENADESVVAGSFTRTAAHLFTDVPFVMVDLDEALSQEYDVTDGDVLLYRPVPYNAPSDYERSRKRYDGQMSRRRLTTWIRESLSWPVVVLERETGFQRFQNSFLPVFCLYGYEDDQDTQDAYQQLYDVAETFRGRAVFTIRMLDLEQPGDVRVRDSLARYGYGNDVELPVFCGYFFKKRHSFPLAAQSTLDSEAMIAHITSVLNKEVLPYEESNPESLEPVADDKGAFLHITRRNFRSVVRDTSKDVVLLYNLPERMCDHCGAMDEYFTEMTLNLHDLPNVVFARIDMDENFGIPGTRVYSFPSLVFFAQANKYHEIFYSGERSVAAMQDWVLQQVDHSSQQALKQDQHVAGELDLDEILSS